MSKVRKSHAIDNETRCVAGAILALESGDAIRLRRQLGLTRERTTACSTSKNSQRRN